VAGRASGVKCYCLSAQLFIGCPCNIACWHASRGLEDWICTGWHASRGLGDWICTGWHAMPVDLRIGSARAGMPCQWTWGLDLHGLACQPVDLGIGSARAGH